MLTSAADASSSALQHAADDCDMYAPTSALYEAQDPCGNYGSTFWPAKRVTGYDELSGVPQYEKCESLRDREAR